MSKIEHSFTQQEKLLEALSEAIIADLKEAITRKGHATLVVSGGSTPKPLFKILRQKEMPWEKVTVTLCDERWVAEQHQESNAKMVKEILLQEKAAKAHFIGMYKEGLTPIQAEAQCSAEIQALSPFDVVILGMGGDGHTASLFPHNEKLQAALDPKQKQQCIAITPTTAPHERMSLTFSAILNTKNLYLHFEGEEKKSLYQEALINENHETLPIRAFLHQEITDIKVYYYA